MASSSQSASAVADVKATPSRALPPLPVYGSEPLSALSSSFRAPASSHLGTSSAQPSGSATPAGSALPAHSELSLSALGEVDFLGRTKAVLPTVSSLPRVNHLSASAVRGTDRSSAPTSAPASAMKSTARSAAPGTDGIVMQSMKTENELLKSQLSEMTRTSAGLRVEIEQMRRDRDTMGRHAERQLKQSTVQRDNYVRDVLAAEQDRVREEAARSEGELVSLREQLSRQKHVEDYRAKQLNTLEDSCKRATDRLRASSNRMYKFAKQLLPTFQLNEELRKRLPFPQCGIGQNDAIGTAVSDSLDFGLQDAMNVMENSACLVELITNAKVETMRLLRQSVTEENTKLKMNLEKSTTVSRATESQVEQMRTAVVAERDDLKHQLNHMQELYESKANEAAVLCDRLQEQLKEAESELLQRDRELLDKTIAVDEMSKAIDGLKGDVEEHETGRAALAAELHEVKRDLKTRTQELESLKLEQKFFRFADSQPTTDSRSGVAEDRIHAMRLVDKLMKENKALKEEKGKWLAEKRELQCSNLRAKMGGSVAHPRELSLMATNRIPDTDLTQKLFQRNLAALSSNNGQ